MEHSGFAQPTLWAAAAAQRAAAFFPCPSMHERPCAFAALQATRAGCAHQPEKDRQQSASQGQLNAGACILAKGDIDGRAWAIPNYVGRLGTLPPTHVPRTELRWGCATSPTISPTSDSSLHAAASTTQSRKNSMPATLLSPSFGSMTPAAKREFVSAEIEKHRNGKLLVFSKTY